MKNIKKLASKIIPSPIVIDFEKNAGNHPEGIERKKAAFLFIHVQLFQSWGSA